MDMLSEKELLKEIIDDVDYELSNEEIISLIVNKQFSEKDNFKRKYTFGQKAADKLAYLAGSWRFILLFILFLGIWIIANQFMGRVAYDPYPFILLNLLLSCLAAIQAPLIMMSQNRQEEKDRQRSINDYRVNLKTEIIIKDIHKKLEIITETQEKSFQSEGE